MTESVNDDAQATRHVAELGSSQRLGCLCGEREKLSALPRQIPTCMTLTALKICNIKWFLSEVINFNAS